MSLTAAVSKVIINGDGTTTAFPYTFLINTADGSDLEVSVVDASSNLTVLTGNYTISVATSTINYPTVGGVSPLATGVNALPSGWQIVIRRVEPLSQNLVLTNQGVFDATSIEAAFDKITMIMQQLQEQLNRCLQYQVNVIPSALQLNPTALTVSISPLVSNGTFSQLRAKAAAAATTQFFCFATDLGTVGQFGFYTGNATAGPNGDGFIFLGGA